VSRLLATATFSLLAGCGYVGPPLPPALHIPKAITDLRVEEVGDKILVRFTPPKETTEGLPITGLRAITLYAGPGEVPFSPEIWSATARPFPISVTSGVVELKAADWVGKVLAFRVRTTGRTGRESDWSNTDILAVGTPLTAPANVAPKNVPDGVELKWTGNASRYRVMRSVDGKLESLAETDVPEYTDRSTVHGTRYEYVIIGLAGMNQQSLPSAPEAIIPADVFAPAVPAGLTAVAGAKSVDLSWTRSPDDDLAGYKIFRAVADGPFDLLAKGIALPAYTDSKVESGKRYRYTVSAVDNADNESDRSVEAAAQVELAG
jgi:hypothetical protein